MEAHKSDPEVQNLGCWQLMAISSQDRGEKAPFSGMGRIATRHLDDGIGEAYALGVMNSLAAPAADSVIKEAAKRCMYGILGLAVNYDHDRGVRLIERSPHLWEAYVSWMRRYKSDRDALETICTFAGLFGVSTPESAPSLAAAGGFGFVFEILDDSQWQKDDEIFQYALCALSDNVDASRQGAELVANEGGPLNGIQVLLRAMRHSRGRHYKAGPLTFGLQYEAVHDTNGLLSHDDANHTWREAFLRGGYVEELLALMADDPSCHKLQDNCCQAIHYLTEGNDTVRQQLEAQGAVDLMTAALRRFAPEKLDGYCTVIHSCSTAMLRFARTSQASLRRMRELGAADVLTDDVLEHAHVGGNEIPGGENFPGGSALSLKTLLKQPAAAAAGLP